MKWKIPRKALTIKTASNKNRNSELANIDKEVKLVTLKISPKVSPIPYGSASKLYQTFRKKIPILCKLFQKLKDKGTSLILWSHYHDSVNHKKAKLQTNILHNQEQNYSTKYQQIKPNKYR